MTTKPRKARIFTFIFIFILTSPPPEPVLPRKSAHTESNRQPNKKHVNKDSLNQRCKLKWPLEMNCRQWQHDEVHHQKYCDPVEQAAHNCRFNQELNPAPCPHENSTCQH